jgi:hypothetical protein
MSDDLEKRAKAYLGISDYVSRTSRELIDELVALLRAVAAEEREACEATVAKVASVHRMRAQSYLDDSDRADAESVEDDIAIEEVKADAVEYAASRIRARGER